MSQEKNSVLHSLHRKLLTILLARKQFLTPAKFVTCEIVMQAADTSVLPQ